MRLKVLNAVIVLLGCFEASFASSERVLTDEALTIDAAGTLLAVEPTFSDPRRSSSLCVGLDSATHTVEVPHLVLRARRAADSAQMMLVMERPTFGAITIAAEARSASDTVALGGRSYVSSHRLCFSGLPDSISAVRLSSDVALTVTSVSFVTTNK